jgi:hypothetical protein
LDRHSYDATADTVADDSAGGLADDPSHALSTYQAVKPVSSQFYNYLSHRVASRAGRHDSQQGSVTAAISGAFASSTKDKATALVKQDYCQDKLPSERFHGRITSVDDCPTSCRAELVYSIDVRALKDQSGSYVVSVHRFPSVRCDLNAKFSSIFKDIILELARAWSKREIRGAIKNYLVVLKPEVRPQSKVAEFCFI